MIRDDLLVAVPTLNRYGGLLELIQSIEAGTVQPARYLVIDNGGWLSGYLDMNDVSLPDRTTVLVPGKNLGVAPSWNLGLKHGFDLTVIPGDDCRVYTDTIEDLVRVADERQGAVFASPISVDDANHSPWSFFLHTRALTDLVGLYDERFWPGYFEDDDYRRRLALAGIEVVRAGQMRHVGGATSQQFREQTLWGNRARYEEKWGGSPGHETVTVPPPVFLRDA
jgi:GT2 family glycosyltransferase